MPHPAIQPVTESFPTKTRVLWGWLLVFISAFCFYLSTAVIRWSQREVSLDSAFFVFARFLLGFLAICAVMGIKRQPLRPRRYDLLAGRALANGVAVYCFYKAVETTTVAAANILNMTYPVFVALILFFVQARNRDKAAIPCTLLGFGGVWLILSPGKLQMSLNHLWGIGSGLSASVAIIVLNVSRQYHDTETILFFMFGLGVGIIWLVFHNQIFWPDRSAMVYLFLCGGLGVLGQYLLTFGFRYVTAVEGSIISSMRIFLAALLGPVLVGEAALGFSGWIGAALLFGVNAYLAVRKARQTIAANSG